MAYDELVLPPNLIGYAREMCIGVSKEFPLKEYNLDMMIDNSLVQYKFNPAASVNRYIVDNMASGSGYMKPDGIPLRYVPKPKEIASGGFVAYRFIPSQYIRQSIGKTSEISFFAEGEKKQIYENKGGLISRVLGGQISIDRERHPLLLLDEGLDPLPITDYKYEGNITYHYRGNWFFTGRRFLFIANEYSIKGDSDYIPQSPALPVLSFWIRPTLNSILKAFGCPSGVSFGKENEQYTELKTICSVDKGFMGATVHLKRFLTNPSGNQMPNQELKLNVEKKAADQISAHLNQLIQKAEPTDIMDLIAMEEYAYHNFLRHARLFGEIEPPCMVPNINIKLVFEARMFGRIKYIEAIAQLIMQFANSKQWEHEGLEIPLAGNKSRYEFIARKGTSIMACLEFEGTGGTLSLFELTGKGHVPEECLNEFLRYLQVNIPRSTEMLRSMEFLPQPR